MSEVESKIIAERYKLEKLVGSGGMARVYGACDLQTNAKVAVKVLRADIAEREEAIERLRREAELLSQIEHPSIVHALDYGHLEDGRIYVVMELLEGRTMRQAMRKETLDLPTLQEILFQVGTALDAAHDKGIVHRDFKPENIFLARDDRGQLDAKLLDFGISKVSGQGRLTATGEVLGTPRYMAPEQLLAEKDIDGRADIYALGVVAYEALTGKSPFEGTKTPTELIVAILYHHVTELQELRPDLPPALSPVVHRAMAQSRKERHPSASQFAREFAEACTL